MKRLRLLIPMLVIMLVIVIVVYVWREHHFAEAYALPTQTPDSVMCVALVGDSWADAKSLDTLITYHLQRFGEGGARSSRVYQNLRNIRHAEFCIVFAGVNDAVGHLGADYYAHHMTLAARALLDAHIKPIFLEVPFVGISEADYYNILSRIKRPLFRYLFDHGETEVVSRYRAALRDSLSGLPVSFIDLDSLSTSFATHPELYRNPVHLNAAGYRVLCERINTVLAAVSSR